MAAATHLGEIDQGSTIARHPSPGETAPNLPAQHHQSLDLGDRLRWLRLSDKSGVVQYRIAAVCLMMLIALRLAL
jgi:hypothetical protein